MKGNTVLSQELDISVLKDCTLEDYQYKGDGLYLYLLYNGNPINLAIHSVVQETKGIFVCNQSPNVSFPVVYKKKISSRLLDFLEHNIISVVSVNKGYDIVVKKTKLHKGGPMRKRVSLTDFDSRKVKLLLKEAIVKGYDREDGDIVYLYLDYKGRNVNLTLYPVEHRSRGLYFIKTSGTQVKIEISFEKNNRIDSELRRGILKGWVNVYVNQGKDVIENIQIQSKQNMKKSNTLSKDVVEITLDDWNNLIKPTLEKIFNVEVNPPHSQEWRLVIKQA
jgi:hypothetical protein